MAALSGIRGVNPALVNVCGAAAADENIVAIRATAGASASLRSAYPTPAGIVT
jgi:hypothetical protein